MKKFEEPIVNVNNIEVEDVITTSTGGGCTIYDPSCSLNIE